jgi:chromosome segregation ATPase
MSNSVIAASVLSLLTGLAGFFIKWMFTKLADGLKESLAELTSELKDLGKKVSELSERYAAAAVRTENSAAEIERFRTRLHDISNIVMEVQATQKRCKSCNKG